MIQTDKEIENQLCIINKRIRQKSKEITIKEVLSNNFILVFVFLVQVIISAKGLYFYFDNLNVFAIIFIIYFIFLIMLLDYCSESLKKDLEIDKKELEKLKKVKENILNFLAYLQSYRYIKSIKTGKIIYPEIQYDDVAYLYNTFNNLYNDKVVRYEDGEKIQVLSEIEEEALDGN